MVIELMLAFVRLCLGTMTLVTKMLAVLLVLAFKLFKALRRSPYFSFALASPTGQPSSPSRHRRFRPPPRRLRRPLRSPRGGRP